MKALSLFSGIGGIDLACEWAGIETVAFCEREPFCQKVLAKHWPNVPIYDDVCTLTKERLEADGIGAIDIIHGGYPCQPFSFAGKREGENDDRHLWPEYFRLIQEIRPRWIVGENVAGHITMGLDNVLSDLESIKYTAQAFVIPACSVNAPHRRDRVFIVAYSESERSTEERQYQPERTEKWLTSGGKVISYTKNFHVQGFDDRPREEQLRRGGWWKVEPDVGRVAHGIPDWVDRLKALGNAVVPQQIYPILAAIKQIDDMIRSEVA